MRAGLLFLAFALPAMTQDSSAADFDFLIGTWNVHNRVLKQRLRGSREWAEFPARLAVRKVLGGLGNVDEFDGGPPDRPIHGMTVRLFDPHSRAWRIFWADDVRPGSFQPPMTGGFSAGRGEFFGDEEVDGVRVKCRFRWTTGAAPRWEQAFSSDGGRAWETNWIMTFTRTGDR